MRPPRLSAKEYVILDLLSQRGECYGLELVQTSDGKLKRGTVYVTLKRMQEKGWVESRLEPSDEPRAGLPRRLFRPTASGLALLRAMELAAAHLHGEELPA